MTLNEATQLRETHKNLINKLDEGVEIFDIIVAPSDYKKFHEMLANYRHWHKKIGIVELLSNHASNDYDVYLIYAYFESDPDSVFGTLSSYIKRNPSIAATQLP